MNKQQMQGLMDARKADIASYQVNIDNYSAILKMIPQALPVELEVYRQQPIDGLIGTLPLDQIVAISDMQFRDKLSHTLIVEMLEQRKSAFILSAIEAQISKEG